MGNGFEALAGMANELKAKAKEREREQEAQKKLHERVARDTQEFLSTMQRFGVKQVGSKPISQAHVTQEDVNFSAVMKKAGVAPLKTAVRVEHKRIHVPRPIQTLADNAQVLQESLSDHFDSVEFLESEDGLSFRRPSVGPDVPRDLRRGRWAVQDQLDLHGLNVDEARESVNEFLKRSQIAENFVVRIIHGKGNSNPNRQSILREVVRRWLKQRDEVLAFCEPKENDGGAGVTIVRLKSLNC